jgi:hypothetical protein
MHRNPEVIALMLAVLAGYGWLVLDLPTVEKAVAILLAMGAFLLAEYAIERLRDRYGPGPS